MKKNLSLAGFGLAAMGLFMGSCVSKRKYMEAQTSAAERYRTDSTDWATRSNTMQQNISSLEQQNTSFKGSIDSLRTTSMNYQKRWDNIQSTYTQATTSTEQLHQEIHNAIDQYVEPSNVESRNGRIYVNLPEKMLFNPGSSTLSTKGKQALDKLATVLASNENVDVDIIATAAYYNGNTATAMNAKSSGDVTMVSANENKNASANKSTQSNSVDANNSVNNNANTETAGNSPTASSDASKANVGDSSFPASGSVTARNKAQDPVKKKSTAKTSTTKKTSTTASTRKTNQGDKSMSFKSSPKSSKTKATASTAPSWNLNVARSTAIVRQLTQNGLPQARIVLAGQNGKGMTTNEWASTNRGYQVVVSPKIDYYQMMQQGQGSTSMK